MYSYKLNNSYTIYVNYEYLNECVRASKQKKAVISDMSYWKTRKEEVYENKRVWDITSF